LTGRPPTLEGATATPPVRLAGTIATLRDLLALTKPGIVTMCLVTTAAGIGLAPGPVSLTLVAFTLLGTALAVGGANALNMYLERDGDRLMERTRRRPLPDGRIAPAVALSFGIFIAALALLLLFVLVNPLTGLLAALALDTYVLLYTPLKRRSHLALLVGAVPGAIPPLIGWTAVTGEIGAPGLVLFGVMVLWQISHFLAIAIYRKNEYAKAGIRVLPLMRGDAPARAHAIAATVLLLPVSLLLFPLGVVSWIYLAVGLAGGAALMARAIQQLRAARGPRGARRFFVATLLYPPMLLFGLIADWVLR